MTDPTPSVSAIILDANETADLPAAVIAQLSRGRQPRTSATAKPTRAKLQETIDNLQRELADARRDAEALRERVELVIASMDYTDASEYAVELRAAIGAPHG